MTLAKKIAKSALAFEASQVSSLQVYKRLIKELKFLNSLGPETAKQAPHNYRSSHSYTFFYSQFLHNKTTDRQLCRPTNELLQRANDYAAYLEANRKLTILREKYAHGEISIAQAAAICGLKMPELKNMTSNPLSE